MYKKFKFKFDKKVRENTLLRHYKNTTLEIKKNIKAQKKLRKILGIQPIYRTFESYLSP